MNNPERIEFRPQDLVGAALRLMQENWGDRQKAIEDAKKVNRQPQLMVLDSQQRTADDLIKTLQKTAAKIIESTHNRHDVFVFGEIEILSALGISEEGARQYLKTLIENREKS